MDQPTDTPRLSSPLDPFLIQLLMHVHFLEHGFAHGSDRMQVAAELDWPIDFLEVVFTSARSRGFLVPVQPPGRRGRVRWQPAAKCWTFFHIDPVHSASNGLVAPRLNTDHSREGVSTP